MTSTKNKFMSFILSFIMAFTVFGVLGTAQVNAAEDVAFTVTLSTTLDEDVTNDSTIKATQIVKEFTAEELDQLADVTDQKYMFSKDGKSANVYKVDKGVELETLIKAAVGETADVSGYAGLKLWDAADLSKYYKKLANFKDHMIADTYYYGDAEYDTETGTIDFGEGTVVEPVLALDFEYATLNADTAGTKADDLTFTEDTELRNRVFLGMLNSEERGGFWSQTNSFGIDLIKCNKDDIAYTVTVNTTEDEEVTADSVLGTPEVVKEFTYGDLYQLADVTDQKYMFSKDGKSANVYKVDKGVELETLIKAAVGETADVNSYAGLKLWDAADLSKYYKKLANFKDHMIADTYYYGGAEYDTETGAIDFGEGTVVDPVLALDFEYATLNADTAGTKADDLTFTKDTELRNRVFLGMLNAEERGGFWSQTNSFGIDLISQAKKDISTATVTVGDYTKTYDGKAKEPVLTVTLGDAVLVQDTDYTVDYTNNTEAGTATATATGINAYTGSVSETFSIDQAKNPMTVKSANKNFKAKTAKKKAQSYKAITVAKAQGTVTYTAKAVNAKSKKALTFNKKNGKITVKKKTRKGTYKMKITVTAKGNTNYAKSTVTKTVTVKVK